MTIDIHLTQSLGFAIRNGYSLVVFVLLLVGFAPMSLASPGEATESDKSMSTVADEETDDHDERPRRTYTGSAGRGEPPAASNANGEESKSTDGAGGFVGYVGLGLKSPDYFYERPKEASGVPFGNIRLGMLIDLRIRESPVYGRFGANYVLMMEGVHDSELSFRSHGFELTGGVAVAAPSGPFQFVSSIGIAAGAFVSDVVSGANDPRKLDIPNSWLLGSYIGIGVRIAIAKGYLELMPKFRADFRFVNEGDAEGREPFVNLRSKSPYLSAGLHVGYFF